MIALTIYGSRRDVDGRTIVRADINSDTTPVTLPKTGEGIEGIDDNAKIDAGSMLKVLDVSDTYIMGDDNEWYRQGA